MSLYRGGALHQALSRAAEGASRGVRAKQLDGYHALNVMEQQLRRTPYLVGEAYSIADVALYAYTHVAEEGGFSLEAYPAIREWLARVASHPRHVGMFD